MSMRCSKCSNSLELFCDSMEGLFGLSRLCQHSWRYALSVSQTPYDAGQRWPSRRVADQLRTEIDQGKYQPGDQLPSYRDLAATRNIAVGTAREAVRQLELEGRVE